MKTAKTLRALAVGLALALTSTTRVVADDDGSGNAKITPVVTVAPTLFAAGKASNAYLCVSNGNPSANKNIQSGDTFRLTLDNAVGAVSSFVSPVLVNSAILTAADFAVTFGATNNQIVIRYTGATKRFAPGDSFCVQVLFTASSNLGSGKMTAQGPSSGGENGRYDNVLPAYTVISIVNFPTGPAGPQGPQGVQGPVGPMGPQGEHGVQGPVGAMGPQGSQGPKGDTGATGATGPQGSNGDKGDIGPQGVQGPAGAAGVQGPQGDQGLAGSQGPQGEPGPPVDLVAGQNITLNASRQGLVISATGGSHDATLTGEGTSGSPLSVSVPLVLTGPGGTYPSPVISATNNVPGGEGVIASGGDSSSGIDGGAGVVGHAGSSQEGFGGIGVIAYGGSNTTLTQKGGAGIYARGGAGFPNGLAGEFIGNVSVQGNISKASGSFKIDHPLDPENKYLLHSFVESPDMMNIYNGTVLLNPNGEATVELPNWFQALNKDFRYSLTAIGAPAPNLHIAEKVANNRFKIAGGVQGIEVSWQITGIRQDAWANKHRIRVEEEKEERERGFYLHPEVFKQPEERGIQWAQYPEMMLQMKQRREEFDRTHANQTAKKNDR